MSLAEDLLNSLPDTAATYSADSAAEPHIVVNADRTVTVPEALRHIAVEGDHNIETVTFDCPRYWDGNDLSQMNLRVVYRRPDGHREPYPVKNLRVDDSDTSMIHFDWTLTNNATKIRGNLSFTVCGKIADAEGIVEREWHTRLNQDLVIDEGMDCSGDEIIEQNPDILESILVRLGTLEFSGGTGSNSGSSSSDSGENPSVTAVNSFVAIPNTIHIIPGKEFRMYYANVIANPDCKLWIGGTSGITVRRYAEYLSITASEAVTKNIAWKLYDNSFNVVDSGSIQVIATAETVKTATALVIGDSTVTQSNSISQKLLDCFTAGGGSLTLLGTRGTSPAMHEGRAGWSAKNYCTNESVSSLSNPFYNNGFDFSYYMAQQGYTGVDIVVIQLGINDIFSMTFENFTATATADYIQQMVASIIGYDSSIKVIVNLLSVPNGDGTSFTEAYGTSQIDFVNLANSIRMSKALIAKFDGSAYVTISPNNCVLDPTTDINDGVHPLIPTGYEKLGQAIYETINGIFDGETEGGGDEVSTSLWDLKRRTGVQHGDGITATTAREMKTSNYYYLDAYTGLSVSPANFSLADYLATEDSLEFTVNAANGISASSLSACGISVPLALEVGKTYTFTAQAASANSGVRLVIYTADGDSWVYSANTPICYNSTDLCSVTITPETGNGYAINFSQKSAGVGTKNEFSNISLVENQ